MNALRLYSPTIVLLVWALLAGIGVDGLALTTGGLVALGLAVVAHTVEITGHR